MKQFALVPLLALLLAACTGASTETSPTTTPSQPRVAISGTSTASTGGAAVPRFRHIVVVIEENHSYSDVIGSPQAPYMNALARSGALLTQSFGVTHPSEPNYLALFSGSTHGVTSDACPLSYRASNLAGQLQAHGLRFVGYADSLPSVGFAGCSSGAYARKHAPWTDFAGLPAAIGQPMSSFPSDYARLPRVSFVIPDLNHDMHDGTIAQADDWLRTHLAGYVAWAHRNDSVLFLTWDEDDFTATNHIPGVIVGAHVRAGGYRQRVDHYTILRTIEAACGLPALGVAARREPIAGIWI